MGLCTGDSLSLALQELMLPARQLLYFHTDPPLWRCVLGGRKEKWQQKKFSFPFPQVSMQYTFSFPEQNASDSVKTEIGIPKNHSRKSSAGLTDFLKVSGTQI